MFAAAPGDGKERGLNRLAREGLVKRAIGGHWSLVPKLGRLATANLIEAYNLPLGTISHLYRDAAAHRAGSLSKIGLGTFVDPRQGGGRINARTTEELVRLMEIDGEEWLFYKVFPVDVALIRGTTADAAGNITMEREALLLDAQAAAMAARNANGLVIAQVERIAATGSLDPRSVVVPGVLVDCVVVAAPGSHMQTYATAYNAAYSSELQVPVDTIAAAALDERKLIARRCAFELPLGGVINLGIGVPEVLGAVAAEERVLDHLTLTAEPGIIGGMPQGGLDFGAAVNKQALLHQNQQFDFYDGGGLDLACLGMAEIDRAGNVNVSRFGSRLAGSGGFINISQSARRLVFAGTFTAGGLQVAVEDGRVRITAEGAKRKFVDAVEQITFSGQRAVATGQPVHYVTERCVFRLRPEGLQLVEVAPGIDIGRDILAHMAFRPLIERRQADGRAHLPPAADGPGRRAARPAARRPAELRRRAQHAVRQLRGHGGAHCGGRGKRAPRGRHAVRRHRKARRVHRQLRRLPARRIGDRRLFRDGRRAAREALPHRDPLHHQRLHAHEARRRAAAAHGGGARVRDAGRGGGIHRPAAGRFLTSSRNPAGVRSGNRRNDGPAAACKAAQGVRAALISQGWQPGRPVTVIGDGEPA